MWQQVAKNFLEAWKKPRWRVALLVAIASDAVAYNPIIVLVPPVEWALDAVTAIALFAALGFKWLMLPALVVEAIPGLMLFPFWTLAVAAMAATEPAEPMKGADGQDPHSK
jgi:hypothetical protein